MYYTWRMIRVFLVFKSTPIQFQTIIYASAVTSNVGDVSEIKLIERQQNMIKENPSVSAKQMSETLSVSSRTIERDLSLMKKWLLKARRL